MTGQIRRTLIAAALVALAAGAVAGSANATRTVKIASKISINVDDSLRFEGRVTAPPAYKPCEEQRQVVLFKVVSGGPDQAVGHDVTDDEGEWKITPQGSAGISMARFYAKVKKRSEGTAGTIYVCLAAKSRTVKPAP